MRASWCGTGTDTCQSFKAVFLLRLVLVMVNASVLLLPAILRRAGKGRAAS
jgi:hypothetical protein